MRMSETLSRRASAVSEGILGVNFFRRRVHAVLARIEKGSLTVVEGDHQFTYGRSEAASPLMAKLTVYDERFYRSIALGGSLGAGEAYIRGFWASDDLPALIRIIVRNTAQNEAMDRGLGRLLNPVRQVLHFMSRNTRTGSKRNIASHYDLGNEFYQLFLDPTMTYSSAYFEDDATTLELASVAKLDRICRKLDLRPEDHVLEIGSGWGSFAMHAARNYGCRVTSATISRAQFDYASQHISEEGLDDRVEIVLQDYRDIEGKYDKIVSIEMIEAVGHAFLPEYFRVLSERLRPQGAAAIQAITIRDQEYKRFRKSVDYIQRYVFPGSCITSHGAIIQAMTSGSDLSALHFEDMTPHYARTLLTWRRRFHANAASVRALGFPESFMRLWDYYLCYCAGGFAERWIGVGQWIFTKPECRSNLTFPATTAPPKFAPSEN